MNRVFFLVLRQMRVPLLLLSVVYAVATIGLTLIPGTNDTGDSRYLDFFHAFYFVSFMGTTTGFGEIPYPFSEGQRMWALLFIYISVATWVYTIGRLIAVLSSDTLKQAITAYQFSRQVSRIREPFALVCGYGDAGSKLIDAMRRRRMLSTVVEIQQARLDYLVLSDAEITVPALCADAGIPENLVVAGICHPMCRHVVALTDDNAVNLHIAITAKVLNPDLSVISRANAHDIEANMASFGTEHIIDPFDSFAQDLGQATYAPYQFLLSLWLRSEPGDQLSEAQKVPSGTWIVCGYGRFGQAIHNEMVDQGLTVKVVEIKPNIPELAPDAIIGDGTLAETLHRADIDSSVGIIAGTDDDSNNLSIIVTAKALNPELFVIVRQNEQANGPLFEASKANVAMEASGVIARKIKSILTNRSIDEFLSLARASDDQWARVLTSRIRQLSQDIYQGEHLLPDIWEILVSDDESPAVSHALRQGARVRISHMLKDHADRNDLLPAIALFYSGDTGAFCLPPVHTLLNEGDKLLFIGSSSARWKMGWTQNNDQSLEYVLSGETEPRTLLGRWMSCLGL